jgi:hypothetical protein
VFLDVHATGGDNPADRTLKRVNTDMRSCGVKLHKRDVGADDGATEDVEQVTVQANLVLVYICLKICGFCHGVRGEDIFSVAYHFLKPMP